MAKNEATDVGRRGFLGALAGVTAGAAAVAGSGLATEAQAQEAGDDRTKARYQPDSVHIQRYYETNRY